MVARSASTLACNLSECGTAGTKPEMGVTFIQAVCFGKAPITLILVN